MSTTKKKTKSVALMHQAMEDKYGPDWRKRPKVLWKNEEWKLIKEAAAERILNGEPALKNSIFLKVQHDVLPKELHKNVLAWNIINKRFDETMKLVEKKRQAREKAKQDELEAKRKKEEEDKKQIQVRRAEKEIVTPAPMPTAKEEPTNSKPPVAEEPPPAPQPAQVHAPQPRTPMGANFIQGLTDLFDRFNTLIQVVDEMLPRIEEKLSDNNALLELILEKGYRVHDHKGPTPVRAVTSKDALERRVAVLGILPGQARMIRDVIGPNKGIKIEDYKDTMPTGTFDLIVVSRFISHADYNKALANAKGRTITCPGGTRTIAETILGTLDGDKLQGAHNRLF